MKLSHECRSCKRCGERHAKSPRAAKNDGFNLQQVDIHRFPRIRVFPEIAHDFELKSDDEFVLGFFEELLGERRFFHVVEVEEEVLFVDVREDESVRLGLVEELQSAGHFVLQLGLLRWLCGLLLLVGA